MADKTALVIVDVQPAFLNTRNRSVVGRIVRRIEKQAYDAYVLASFSAQKGSLWDKQQGWACEKGTQTKVVPEITDALKGKRPIIVEKGTKSVFADAAIGRQLKRRGISRVEVVGLDTNDCVLATAYDAFDGGFLTHVIEKCCDTSASPKLHKAAVQLLRHQHMTDASRL